MTGSAVVAGAVAQKPLHGGHAWVFLQLLLGLRRLGWRVLLVDRLPPDPPASRSRVSVDAWLARAARL